MTALHGVHEANGAKFGQKFGWERVNYFAPGDAAVAKTHTIDAPPAWLNYARAEHAHCRENVALFDVSSFAKLLVSGEDAEACMQRLCCGDVSEVHTATYTGMLNEAGGYESDVTVTKLDATSFLVVAPTGQATRDADWIRRHLTGRDATLVDVSNQIAVLAVMGPQSRALLRACVADPAALDDDAFPFGASRDLDVGHATCRAQRITYVGELGYELYVPVESAAHVYRSLHAASQAHATADLRDGGYYAIDSLRTEKAYRAWGHELDPTVTPFEAGLAFTIDWSKDFIGKEALEALKTRPLEQRLVALRVDETRLPIWGNEPVFRNGDLVGNVTTANYAHSLGGQVALAFVKHPDVGTKGFVAAGDYEIDCGGTRVKAKASLRAPFDPTHKRIKGDYDDAAPPTPRRVAA